MNAFQKPFRFKAFKSQSFCFFQSENFNLLSLKIMIKLNLKIETENSHMLFTSIKTNQQKSYVIQ